MKKLLMVLAILALMVSPVWATAWTATSMVGVLHLVPADATTSYDSSTLWTNGVYITSIEFVPSAANDVLVVRHGSASGVVIAAFKSIDGGPQIIYFDGKRVFRPYILYTDNTISGTATAASVNIKYGNAP